VAQSRHSSSLVFVLATMLANFPVAKREMWKFVAFRGRCVVMMWKIMPSAPHANYDCVDYDALKLNEAQPGICIFAMGDTSSART